MTTDVSLAFAPDMSVDNDVMNIGRFLPAGHAPLAGVAWTTSALSTQALSSTMAVAIRSLDHLAPKLSTWLLIGNSAWQPDSQIVRHRGLWGGLRARGLTISEASDPLTLTVEHEGRLKFFAATRLLPSAIPATAEVMLAERCSYIAALPENAALDSLLQTQWTGDVTRDMGLVIAVSESGLLLKPVGAFDDPEQGMVAIGSPPLVRRLARFAP